MFEASDELRASSHFEHCCPIIRANASYLSCVVETICWRKQIRTACLQAWRIPLSAKTFREQGGVPR